MANSVVIALGLAISENEPQLFLVVSLMAAIPAGFTGLVAGSLVGAMPKSPVWWRLITLLVPSFGLVAVLATQFGMGGYILVASIPTLVACLVLERWTRWTGDDELPVARVT